MFLITRNIMKTPMWATSTMLKPKELSSIYQIRSQVREKEERDREGGREGSKEGTR